MDEESLDAVRAILLCLKNYGEPLNLINIDRVVFCGFAEDVRLLKLLSAMTKQGWIKQDSGRYSITKFGRNQLDEWRWDENAAVCRQRGAHEWYLENGNSYCRQCGARREGIADDAV